jgi:hypothetical protein
MSPDVEALYTKYKQRKREEAEPQDASPDQRS